MGRLLKGAMVRRQRLLHTIFAVALAVSLVSGTFVLTDTIDAAFQRASTSARSHVDVVVRATSRFTPNGTSLAGREPLPESLLDRVRSVPGVQSAWGTVAGYATLSSPGSAESGSRRRPAAGGSRSAPALGSAWTPDDVLVAGRRPSGPDGVVVDAATARAGGVRPGDRVQVVFGTATGEFRVDGLFRAPGGLESSVVAFELATAQRVLSRPATLDAISVRASSGVGPEPLRAGVGRVLPGRYEAVTGRQAAEEDAASWTASLAFLKTGLLVFAGVALLVGAFLIFNTFSILVAQRTRELGLLRALGASRAQVTTSVLGEALAVGLVASVAGIIGGFAAARALLALMQGVGLRVPATSVVFLPRTAAVGLLSGVLVTTLAAFPPARRATRISPVAGLSGRGAERTTSRRRHLLPGPATIGAGMALVAVGLSGGAPQPFVALGLGAGLLLVGLALLTPLLARPAARLLAAPLVRLAGQPAVLGRENAARNPRRTSATAAALMIGIGLVGVVSIMAASMKASAAKSVRDSLRADFVVTAQAGPAAGVPPLVADRLRGAPGVGVVSEVRAGQWGLDGTTETLIAVDPRTVTAVHRLDPASVAAARRLDDDGVLVRDTVAARHGWRAGDEVPMTFARTGTRKLRLAATYSATTVRSDYVVSLGAFDANYTQALDVEVDVGLARGTGPVAGLGQIRRALSDLPSVAVMNRSEMVAAQQHQVDRILVPVTALLALSVLIALLGIANTLALSIHERTRELGLLRAIGMACGQLRSMIRSEALIIASFGAGLGVVVAVFFGWAPVAAMHDRGVTQLVFPVGQLAGLVAAAAVAGLVAGILPARRAVQLGVLEAVGEE